MTEHDYLEMQAGKRWRLEQPDGYTAQGKPIWHHTPYMRKSIEHTLDLHCRDKIVYENVACNVGRTVVLNFVGGGVGLLGVTYFAVGTGVITTPTSADTLLVSEQFRKLLTSSTISGNTVIMATFFLSGEGNYNYTEAGIFGTATATGTANSGTLFAHALYAYNKTAAVTLTNDYTVYLN